MGSGLKIGESTACCNTLQILYGISLPSDPSVPEAPAPGKDDNNINNINNPPNQEAENAPKSPGGYNEVLAHLMRNVGRKAWTTVERGEIEKLSEDVLGQIKPEERTRRKALQDRFKAFADAADGIQAKLKTLSTYSVREMAAALKHVQDFAAKVENARQPTKREAAMVRELTSLVESLFGLSNDLSEFSMAADLPDDLCKRLDDMVLTLDSRATELNLLGLQLAEMADRLPGKEGEGNVVDFSKGMGGIMHGNYESVAGQDSLKVVAVAEKLDQMRKDQGPVEDVGGKMDVIKCDGKEDVREEGGGTVSKKLAQTMTPGMLAGLEKESDEMLARLKGKRTLTDEALLSARLRFVKMIPNAFKDCLKDVRPQTLQSCPGLSRLIETHAKYTKALEQEAREGCRAKLEALTTAIDEYGLFFNEENAQETLNVLLDELKALNGKKKLTEAGVRMKNALQEVCDKHFNDGKTAEFLARAVFDSPRIEIILDAYRFRVWNLGNTQGAPLKFLASDIPSVAVGGGQLSDHLLASMYGIDVKWIDPWLNDKNVHKSIGLGSGGVSDVKMITYMEPGGGPEDRVEFIVFKPDFLASAGNVRLALYHGGYKGYEQALKLNIASNVIAKGLGCEDLLTKTSAVFHENRLGIGMSVAKGDSAQESSKAFGKNGAVTKLLDSRDENKRKKGLSIVNDLARQTTDLQWLDLLAGQGDRHEKNYFVDIDTKAGKVAVTGIDNDMCMPMTRTGLTRLKLVPADLVKVRKKLVELFKSCKNHFKGVAPDEAADRMMREYFNEEGEIDFGRTDLPPELVYALKKTFGVHTLAVPTVMSQTMYDRLKAIADISDDRKRRNVINEMFVNDLQEGLHLPGGNVEAFKSRLDDLLNMVKSGRILVVPEPSEDNPTWLAKDVQARLRQSANYYPAQVGQPPDRQYGDAVAIAKRLKSPFLFRDFSDLMNHAAVRELAAEADEKPESGYAKLPEATKEFLREVAHMSYGVGDGGRKGGGGRIGLLEKAGSLRVIKYNTHWSERRWLFGKNPATQAMKDSSNALREKLVSIARMSGLSPAKIVQVRNLLGLKGDAETADTLLDRTTVAEVLEIIGGDDLWKEAEPARGWNAYASEKDMSFARVSNPEIVLDGHPSLGKRLERLRSFSSGQFKTLLKKAKKTFLADMMNYHPSKEHKERFEDAVFAVFGTQSIEKLVRDRFGAVNEEDVKKRVVACFRHIWRAVKSEEAITSAAQEQLTNECHALIADGNYLLRTRFAVGRTVTVGGLQERGISFEALEDLVDKRPNVRGLLLVPSGLDLLAAAFKRNAAKPETALDELLKMDADSLEEAAEIPYLWEKSELIKWIDDNRPKGT